MSFKTIGLVAALALASANAHAVIIKGPYVFDDNAFADQINLLAGSVAGALVNTTTLDDLAGSSLGDTVEGTFAPVDTQIEFVFTDNAIVNGVGADFVVFEAAAAETFQIIVNGVMQSFTPVSLGFSEFWNVNAAAIDLSTFGVAAGASVTSVVWQNTPTGSDPTGVGALNSIAAVPEPTALALVGLGLAGFASARGAKR